MRSDVNVKGKKKTNAIPEPFYFISLDITEDYDIESSLDKYFEAENLDDYKVGQKFAEASTKRHLLSSPNILLLHIKWFYYDEGRLYKDDSEITYPEILTMKKVYMCEESSQNKNVSYELIGLIVHRGKNLNKGHYFAYTLIEGVWYSCDDKVIKSVSDTQAYGQQAYILVYWKFT